MPALLRRDKTCCWWVGGKALRAASGEGANKGPAARAEPRAWSSRDGHPDSAGAARGGEGVLGAAARGRGHASRKAGAAAGRQSSLAL